MFGIIEYSSVLVGLFSICSIYYWYLSRNFNYWSKQGIKGPRPIIIFGNFWDRIKNNLAIIDLKYMKEFGNIYGIFNGTVPVLHIAEPELIKQVLVKDFHRFTNRRELLTEHSIVNNNLFNAKDDDWKRMRTITSSTFTSGKMKKLYNLIRKCLQNYLDQFEQFSKEGKGVEIKGFYEKFTMDVIACCAFATQTNSLKEPDNPFIVNGKKFFILNTFRFVSSFILPKFVNNLLGFKYNFNPEANECIIGLAKLIVEKRVQTHQKYNDFLQLLIDARIEDHKKGDYEEGLESHYLNEVEEDIDIKNKYVANRMSENEIIAQCWVFLLAGFETTATALGYLSYELAVNQDCQQRLYKEVSTAMGSDKEISYDDLHQLQYLDACVSEVLRLCPPVTRLEREVNQDFKLGESQIRLFKGQLIEIPVYAIHHSEQYFANADQFNPDRFLRQNRNQIIPYTYMPFGTGPRTCIGMRFALMEIKLAMAHIILRYRLTKCDKTEKSFQFQPLTPMLAANSVTIGVERR